MLVKILIAGYLIIGFLIGCFGLAGLKYNDDAKTRLAYRLWEAYASSSDKLLFYCKMMILWLPIIIIRLVEMLVDHIMSA